MSHDRADFLSRLFSRPEPAGLADDASAKAMLEAFRVAPGDHSLFEVTLAGTLDLLGNEHGFALSEDDEAAIAKVLAAFYEQGPAIAYVYHESDEWHPNYLQLMDVTDESGRNLSFIGSDASFERVQALEARNLIVPVVGDFAGPKALRAIGDYARAHGASVDVFYVSNVEHYLFEDDSWRAFYGNVMTLPVTDKSRFVRTLFGSTARACPDQRVSVRTPVTGSIEGLLARFGSGRIETECDLIVSPRRQPGRTARVDGLRYK
jgi:hypothetical protein